MVAQPGRTRDAAGRNAPRGNVAGIGLEKLSYRGRRFPGFVKRFSFAVLVSLSGIYACATSAADETEARAFFEKKIRPVLVENCFECHAEGAKKIGGKLRLDTAEGLRKGGESGTPMVPGNPEESLLVQSLRWEFDLEMPPEKPLSPAVIQDFVTWIRMGAQDPRESTPAVSPPPDANTIAELAKTHWSFQPVANPEAPIVDDENWPRDPLDRFVLAGMEKAELAPTSDAPPGVLLRRLFFDLTGLPPTASQVADFAEEYERDGQEAVARWVDDLLASPQFGERWARHWLDVARYGESNGNDGLSRNPSFPHAWRYRDYVIDAFNRDVPYDRFLIEQVAGDLLPAENDAQRDRQLVATGFLALGAKPAKAMNNNFEMDVVDDQINVVGAGIMGLSVACARCHDHKHDPIPTRDYYALAGIFKSTETMWGVAANEALTAPATDLHVLKAAAKVPPPKGWKETVLVIESNTGKPKPPPKPKWEPGTPLAMGVRDKKETADCQINLKGESKQLGDKVPRGFLSACSLPGDAIKVNPKASGRRELAEWLTRPEHPLTARVMVNRIWLHLFGQAIVGTPDDFGVYGDRPTHPELLDHLATRFVAEGWSMKRLIRTIVLSRVYQLDSAADLRMVEADPGNVWLARHLRRRLEAESLRDSMLAASGQLDLAPAQGSLIRHRDILVNLAGNLHEPSRHRSVYLCMLRNSPPPSLSAFDLPDATTVLGKRSSTVLPTQSLYLINSPFAVEQSLAFAGDLLKTDPAREQDRARAEAAVRRALGREPQSGEAERGLAMIRAIEPELATKFSDVEECRLHAWAAFCQGLMATNEFRYVD
ncbi:MAG: PSD1 domain-containing protein [Verrucomicrobiae bacterium]|nr:PSD1 domain-containing protein [Verrucomicrobiae bacterium]